MDFLLDPALELAGSPWIYALVFGLAIMDGLLPPMPSETVIVGAAAISAATGRPDWALIAFAAAAGAFTGDNLTYALGRMVDTRRVRWLQGRRAQRAIDVASRGLMRGGASAIFVARYIPVGRVAVNLTAGAVGFPRRRFVLLSLGAAITWAAYSVAIGYLAGRLFSENPLIGILAGVVLAIVLGIAVDRTIAFFRRRRGRAGSGSEQERAREQHGNAADGREEHGVAAEDVTDAVSLGEVEDVLGGGQRGKYHDDVESVVFEREGESSEKVRR